MDLFDWFLTPAVLLFAANALYLGSYLAPGMVWLRALAIVAAAVMVTFLYVQTEPQWNGILWHAGFLTANALNLAYLLYRMRIPHFDLFEQVVYREKFYELEPHEVIPIFKHARRLSVEEEQVLLRDGQSNETLFLVVSGKCRIDKNDRQVATLQNGDFIGELSFVSDEPVNADVIALPGAELMCWNKSDLQPLFERQGLYKAFFYSLFSVDIAQKLRAMTASATA